MEDEILQQKAPRTRESGKGLGYTIIALFVLSIGVGIFSVATREEPEPVVVAPSPMEMLFNIEESFGGSGMRSSSKDPGIQIIKVYGPISMVQNQGFAGLDQYATNPVIRKLKSAQENSKVKGVVLHVNTPGGTVAASEEIYEAIVELKEAGKPVYVSMGDLAASGGYYIAAPATKIFANSGTLTGSIGVFIGNFNLTGLSDKIGVDFEVIKGGKHKDILSAWRDLTEEERAILQETVDGIYDQFLTIVSEGRGIDMAELRTFADGRIFNGEQAKEYRLVDELGSLEDTVESLWAALEMEGEPNILGASDNPFDRFRELLEMRIAGPQQQPTLESFIFGDSMNRSIPITLTYPGM